VSSEIQQATESLGTLPLLPRLIRKAATGPPRWPKPPQGKRREGSSGISQSTEFRNARATTRICPRRYSMNRPEPIPPRVTHSHAIPACRSERLESGWCKHEGTLWRSRTFLADFFVKCNSAAYDLSTRQSSRKQIMLQAGPGVFVLTDSDLTSYYYVEACQTLRIAIAILPARRIQGPRRGFDQAAASAASRNSGSARREVSCGALRGCDGCNWMKALPILRILSSRVLRPALTSRKSTAENVQKTSSGMASSSPFALLVTPFEVRSIAVHCALLPFDPQYRPFSARYWHLPQATFKL